MSLFRSRLLVPLLIAVAAIAAAFGHFAGRRAELGAIAQLQAETVADATLRATLLRGDIERFRLMPVALTEDRGVLAALAGVPGATEALNRRLKMLARETGAENIYLLDPRGRAISSSNYDTPRSFVGQDYAFRDYYREAVREGAGVQFGMGTVSRRPGLYVSHRTEGGGYIVVKRVFGRLEQDWARAGGLTLVTDTNGIVVASSDPALRFRATRPLTPAQVAYFRQEMQSGDASVRLLQIETALGGRLVRLEGDRTRRVSAHVPAGDLGWTLHLYKPADPAATRAGRAVWLATALGVALIAALAWALALRIRQRRIRTAALEEEVAARTAQLRAAMDERAAGERRADELREELRQANRLAILGQITAGVAHETAQPVAAIRSYAANGIAFLDRGDSAAAAANFGAISRLTERIGAVTSELRGFARKGTGEIVALRVSEVIEGAALILRNRLTRIAFTVDLGADPPVRAGRVRLEQVFVNLIQNALDALEGRGDGRVEIRLDGDEESVRVRISDNGPGIPPEVAERLFTPFATSRANGLGLGLVIAHDIMRELGGALAWIPGDGGACFELTLQRAQA
ncbi:two-component system C4-dicarboxylate transport sensor histidine kinase DctB [Sphingomonas zeicaulis]|uniref:sensor histidine kinase n=1 Tax=Sphingomonas zeicaulis TaxID=1632740 RepID=UPI003D1E9AFF